MPTIRFYFPRDTPAPVSVARAPYWAGQSLSAGGRGMVTSRPSSGIAAPVGGSLTVTGPGMFFQGIGPGTLPAGHLTGTFRAVFAASEVFDANDARVAVVARVVSGDGTTVRGTVFQGTAQVEVGYPSTNYRSGTVSGRFAVDVQPGDRLVIEAGVSQAKSPGTNYPGSAEFLDPDMPFADLVLTGQTTVRHVYWAELIVDDPPAPPTNLRTTYVGTTEAVIEFDAPTTGPAPVEYELRRNGVVLGTVPASGTTSFSLYQLTPGATYTIDIRTLTAAGASAWSTPLVFTTAEPPPPPHPWLVSEQLLWRAGHNPLTAQPAFLWEQPTGGGGWTTHDTRSRALIGWTIATGRTDPREKVPPTVVTVQLAYWPAELGAHGIDYTAPGLPELGQRFRLALSTALQAANLPGPDLPRFTGEVTDVSLDTRRRVVTVTGVGRYARGGRLQLDPTGWPAEREGARVARILAGIGATVGTLDPGRVLLEPPTAVATAQAHVEAVSESTAGQLVERRDGALDWHDADHRRDAPELLELAAAELLAGFTWAQRVGDLTNTVAVTYAGGVETVTDDASVAARDAYPGSVSTQLVARTAAAAIGGVIVGRYADPVWLLPAVMVDLIRSLDPADLPTAVGLGHGDKIRLTGLPPGGPYTTAGVYVEGVTEQLTSRRWQLVLTTADERLAGAPIRWRDVPAGVSWAQVQAGLSWLDAYALHDPNDLT